MDLKGNAHQDGGAATAPASFVCGNWVPNAMPAGAPGKPLEGWEGWAQMSMFLQKQNLTWKLQSSTEGLAASA